MHAIEVFLMHEILLFGTGVAVGVLLHFVWIGFIKREFLK